MHLWSILHLTPPLGCPYILSRRARLARAPGIFSIGARGWLALREYSLSTCAIPFIRTPGLPRTPYTTKSIRAFEQPLPSQTQ
eukprot:3457049-Pyramimonas_sp.AAC.1